MPGFTPLDPLVRIRRWCRPGIVHRVRLGRDKGWQCWWLRIGTEKELGIQMNPAIWGVPRIMVPNHPFTDGFSRKTIQLLGYPIKMETPISTEFGSKKNTRKWIIRISFGLQQWWHDPLLPSTGCWSCCPQQPDPADFTPAVAAKSLRLQQLGRSGWCSADLGFEQWKKL